MRLHLVLAALPLLLSAQLAFAADDSPKVNFDQGVDASAILERAREKSGVSGLPPLQPLLQRESLPELDKISIPASLVEAFVSLPEPATKACDNWDPDQDGRGSGKSCAKSEEPNSCPEKITVHSLLPKSIQKIKIPKGVILGPFRPLPDQSAVYRDGLGWRQKIDPLPAPVRDPLVRDWNGIESNRSGLINDGSNLDVEDEALYADAVRINIWRDRIDARAVVFNQWLPQYNQQCLGRPLPPDEFKTCKNWADRYNGCVNRHNASVQRYNAAVAAWKSAYASLNSRGGVFISRVQDWEILRIKPFIEQAKKALEAKCDKLVGMEIFPAAPPPVQVGGGTLDFFATPAFASPGDNPCPVSYLWTTKNTSGNIGTLLIDPKDQKHATLTSGKDPAQGLVIVDGKDTMGATAAASAPVTVVKGALQCKLLFHSCNPEGPPYEVVCSYDCCGTPAEGRYYSNTCASGVCGTRFCAP